MTSEQRPFIVAEITSVEQAVSERQKRYTTYIIHIYTAGTTTRHEWIVDRRYSKFYDLRVLLKKKFKNASGLPTLPKKRYIDVFNPEFLQQRRVALQKYLDELLSRPVEISLSEEVCLFLEVPEALRAHFLEMDDMSAPHAIIKDVSDHSNDRTEGSQKDGCKVTEFLNQMEEAPNSRASTMLSFKKTVMTDMPQWDENQMRLLYLGKENRGGLLAEVGAFDHSAVSSIAALSLLSFLVSSLFCIEAPASITVLRQLDFSILQMMKLSAHIHTVRGRDNRQDAYNVLKALSWSLDRTQELLNDDWAFSEYCKWLDGVAYRTQELRTIHVSCELRRVPARLSHHVHDHSHDASRFKEYAKLEEEIVNELRSCFANFNPFCARGANQKTSPTESWGGWRVAPTPVELEEYDVRLDYHKFSCSADGSWMIRLKLRLPSVSCFALMSLLKDHRSFLEAAIAEKAESLSKESLGFLEGLRQNVLFPNVQTTKVHDVLQSTYGVDGLSEVVEVTVRREKYMKSRKVLKFMCSNASPWTNGYLFALSSLPTGCQACRSSHDILPSGLLIVPAGAHHQPSFSSASSEASPTHNVTAKPLDAPVGPTSLVASSPNTEPLDAVVGPTSLSAFPASAKPLDAPTSPTSLAASPPNAELLDSTHDSFVPITNGHVSDGKHEDRYKTFTVYAPDDVPDVQHGYSYRTLIRQATDDSFNGKHLFPYRTHTRHGTDDSANGKHFTPFRAQSRHDTGDSVDRFSQRCSTFDDGRFSSWDETAFGEERMSPFRTAEMMESMVERDASVSAMQHTDSELTGSATGCDVVLLGTLGQQALGLISDDLLGEMGCFWSSLNQVLSVFKQLGPLPADFDPANHPACMATVAS